MRFQVDFVEQLERKTQMIIEVEDPDELKEKGVRSALESIVAEWPEDYYETDSVWGVCVDNVNKIKPEKGEAVHYLIRDDGDIRLTEDEDEYREAMGLVEDPDEAPPPLPGQMGLDGIGEDVPADKEAQ
jgi:hypothetical protein